jgi:hypothetical protein
MENRTQAPQRRPQQARAIKAIQPTRITRQSTEPLLRTTAVQRRPRRSLRSRLHRTSPTRHRPLHRSSTVRMSRLHRRPIRLATISPGVTPRATMTIVRISRKSMLPSRLRRCRSTSNPTAPATTISGRRDIGIGRRPVITGCQVPGFSRRMLEPCGRRDTGALRAAVMAGITDIGGHTLASMVASITATDTLAAAIRAGTGIAAPFITTAPLRA